MCAKRRASVDGRRTTVPITMAGAMPPMKMAAGKVHHRAASLPKSALERASEKWLLANHDSNANIYTISSGISLADLYQDGDYRLLIGDIGFTGSPKLKVYHGTYLQCENLLVDIPCGVVVVHNDKPELTTSVIVASGSYLFVYRNLKPFYKFSLPPLETNKIESDAWTRYKDMRINVGTLEEILNNLRLEIGRRRLTSRSQMLLSLISAETKTLFAESFKNHPLKKMNVITCMATLKKTVSDANAPSCLILGTENQEAYILEIDAYTILSTATLPSVPVFIEASGLFDVEYRILFACRDAHIYLIKRGYSSGRLCIQLNSHPVGLARIGSNIYVACMDHTLSIFTTKGNRVWNMKQPAAITTMEAIFLERQGLHIIAVALANKKVMFYNDRKCVDILHMHDIVVAMKFGRFGREDNTLVMVSKRGALTVKILKRTAKFIAREYEEEASKAASGSAAGKLILNAARTYVKALQSSLNPISLNTSDSIKLSAKLNLELQNSNGDNFPTDLMMVFEYDAKIYRLERNVIQIACLLATATYRYTNRVHCISEMNLSDAIKIYILYENEEVPLVTAVINMPRSELETLPESDATNQRPPLGETNQF
ncbi:Bardet-Biedl syndrome 1 protein, partial [Tyrophagus putrescentiae]